ncbi:MAG TPA: hypothetical protein VK110_01450 [Salinisphaeraceae bacterium]|nr:hypothetical protein [Salinisphaeraceae bacterium]
MMEEALALTQALVRRPSITPDDAGCQQLLGERLEAAGFAVTHLRCGQVNNLWAVAGARPAAVPRRAYRCRAARPRKPSGSIHRSPG